MRFQPDAMSAWSECGQPRVARVPILMSVPWGMSGQRSNPTRAGFTAALHTEVENAVDQQARIIRILHKQRDFIGQQDERKPPESE